MTEQEMLDQVESLIDDRNSFIDPLDNDKNNIFRKDKEALIWITKRYKEQQKALEQKDKMIKKAYIEANNVLYFDDNSDYCSALWTILHTLNPDLEEYPELSYIDESEVE